jgi:hypothetical protein
MFVKKTIATTLFTLGLSLPLFAHAELVIDNDTNQPSTSIINSGFCSTTILGDDGITPAKTKKTIPDWQIDLACIGDTDNCRADVYMTNDCTGDVITSVIFSTSTGIKSVTTPINGYTITYSAFYVKLSGGPSVVSKK